MSHQFSDKIFYHIYALGLGGCPKRNDFDSPAGTFFETLAGDLDRIKSLGCNAILIGPIFESTAHGYDTVDYFHVDRRLGNNESFARFSKICHEKGFALVLDAVFNHTGRDFFAFKDLQQNGECSPHRDWYLNLDFSRRSDEGDCFDYEGWAGCKDLVKFNGDNPAVREYLFGAVRQWIEEFGIDGLRLDAADVLSKDFLDALGSFCRGIRPDFWLMGEVVHGDYRDWTQEGRIDSVTNYQIYKALWSSLNDQNLFELSFNLDREFNTEEGMYTNAALYNFVDNHDVNRAGSTLSECERHLPLLYGLLFTIPGIPSVYYGSEYGLKGERSDCGDFKLRPSLPPFAPVPDELKQSFDTGGLPAHIARLAKIRAENSALQNGTFTLAYTANRQLAFWREDERQKLLIAANSDFEDTTLELPAVSEGEYEDALSGNTYPATQLRTLRLAPCSLLVLRKK